MGVATQDRVADIIIVGGLNIVKEDHVFQLHGVAHHSLLADDSAAADERAVPNLRLMVDDAGPADVGRGEHFGVFCNPDILAGVVILIQGQGCAQGLDVVAQLTQNFPGVGLALKQRRRDGII